MDGGLRQGLTTDEKAKLNDLGRSQELRRANEGRRSHGSPPRSVSTRAKHGSVVPVTGPRGLRWSRGPGPAPPAQCGRAARSRPHAHADTAPRTGGRDDWLRRDRWVRVVPERHPLLFWSRIPIIGRWQPKQLVRSLTETSRLQCAQTPWEVCIAWHQDELAGCRG